MPDLGGAPAKGQGVAGGKGKQDAWMKGDPLGHLRRRSPRTSRPSPVRKNDPTRCVPPRLDEEQPAEDDRRQRHDQAGDTRIGQLESLHRGEDGDGGSDDRVTVEETRAEEADDCD